MMTAVFSETPAYNFSYNLGSILLELVIFHKQGLVRI